MKVFILTILLSVRALYTHKCSKETITCLRNSNSAFITNMVDSLIPLNYFT